MAAERGHVVGTLLSLSAAGPMFEAYRKRAQELGWTAGPDRFAYAAVVGVGATREEGLRRANLAADYVRTSPVVAEPFTNPPGYNSLSANVAMLLKRAASAAGSSGIGTATRSSRLPRQSSS